MTEAEAALLEVGGILDRLEVPFFLILGTCLGVVRDGRLIPWDKDIDLGALVEDLTPKVPAIIEAAREAGWDATPRSRPLKYDRAVVFRKAGQKIDLAGFLREKDHRFSPSSLVDYCLVYPASIIEDRGTVTYLGREWATPAPVERYLRAHYGRAWRTPDKNWNPQLGPARQRGYFRRTEYANGIDHRDLRPASPRAHGLSAAGRHLRGRLNRRRDLR